MIQMLSLKTLFQKDLRQYCAKMTQVVGKEGFSYCMDLEHIVNAQYQLILDKSKTFYLFKFQGGYAAGIIRKLEIAGFVKIESFIEFGNGCIEYTAKNLLSGKIFKHTEYPPCWNTAKIAQETIALYEQAIQQKIVNFTDNNPINLLNQEGFYLQYITTNVPKNHICASIKNTFNKHIVTAHPIYKG